MGEALLNRLTEILGRTQAGESGARDALFAAAYAELHLLARARLREGARDVVLDTTCLVHESYLRFVSAGELRAEDRRAFFAYASQVTLSTKATGSEFTICASGKASYDRRRGKYGATMEGSL
jgi:hypothetical protein